MPKTEKPKGKNLLRQKILRKKILANTGKPMKQLMKESGYKDGYAKNPQDLVQTKNWQEMVDKDIPDKLLLREHKKLFKAEELQQFVFPSSMSDEELKGVIKRIRGARFVHIQRGLVWVRVFFTHPDFKTKKEGVKLGYEVKGKLGAGAPSIGQQINAQFNISDETLERITS